MISDDDPDRQASNNDQPGRPAAEDAPASPSGNDTEDGNSLEDENQQDGGFLSNLPARRLSREENLEEALLSFFNEIENQIEHRERRLDSLVAPLNDALARLEKTINKTADKTAAQEQAPVEEAAAPAGGEDSASRRPEASQPEAPRPPEETIPPASRRPEPPETPKRRTLSVNDYRYEEKAGDGEDPVPGAEGRSSLVTALGAGAVVAGLVIGSLYLGVGNLQEEMRTAPADESVLESSDSTGNVIAEEDKASADPYAGLSPAEKLKLERQQRIAKIQALLTQLEFGPGPVDGVLRPETRDAIRAFQRRMGLPADGEPSATVLQEMRMLAEVLRMGEELIAEPPAQDETESGTDSTDGAGDTGEDGKKDAASGDAADPTPGDSGAPGKQVPPSNSGTAPRPLMPEPKAPPPPPTSGDIPL